jgi:hypothetical protein
MSMTLKKFLRDLQPKKIIKKSQNKLQLPKKGNALILTQL